MCQQGTLIQWTFGSCFRQTRGRILFLELCSGFLALNSHLSKGKDSMTGMWGSYIGNALQSGAFNGSKQ